MNRDGSFLTWGVVLTVLVALAGAALVFGPRLFEAGSGVVGPVTTLIRLDKEVERLNGALPFTPPEPEVVDPTRLEVFLGLRRELAPRLAAWNQTVSAAEAEGKSWRAVKGVLGDLEDFVTAQVKLHERLGISPAEARWLDGVVYRRWLPAVEAELAVGLAGADATAARAESDLTFVADLESRFGSSPATRAMRARLEARLAELADPARPEIEGLPETTQALLWSRRREIAELKVANPHDAPLLYRENGGVSVSVGRQG